MRHCSEEALFYLQDLFWRRNCKSFCGVLCKHGHISILMKETIIFSYFAVILFYFSLGFLLNGALFHE